MTPNTLLPRFPRMTATTLTTLLITVTTSTHQSSAFLPPTQPITSPRHYYPHFLTLPATNPNNDTTTPLPPTTPPAPPTTPKLLSLSEATTILQNHETTLNTFVTTDNSRGLGGGLSASTYLTTLTPSEKTTLRSAVSSLAHYATLQRDATNTQYGRVMLGICSSSVTDALGTLKSWVSSLALPRGLLHGADVDGVPVDPETLGKVYVK
eukprot:CAMPEP_0172492956 /NCGR_PEP_ID=MMETSP1066-20121228/24253_1 /TAXON_ID=671091 /ORGANISM="Coscinodiscus wailesii, Strain CCMP2513" /LENGTH=208 /DNA_ID=CAMNT_0013262859 /DNA_START=183 /DNA_END=806 /DNA_ORIENTATION=+